MLNVLAMQENLLKMKGKAVPQKDHEISEAIKQGMARLAREEKAKNQPAAKGHGQGQGQGQGQDVPQHSAQDVLVTTAVAVETVPGILRQDNFIAVAMRDVFSSCRPCTFGRGNHLFGGCMCNCTGIDPSQLFCPACDVRRRHGAAFLCLNP